MYGCVVLALFLMVRCQCDGGASCKSKISHAAYVLGVKGCKGPGCDNPGASSLNPYCCSGRVCGGQHSNRNGCARSSGVDVCPEEPDLKRARVPEAAISGHADGDVSMEDKLPTARQQAYETDRTLTDKVARAKQHVDECRDTLKEAERIYAELLSRPILKLDDEAETNRLILKLADEAETKTLTSELKEKIALEAASDENIDDILAGCD